MKVSFLDLRAAYLEIQPEIDASVQRVLSGGWYLLGEELSAFEAEFARYCEVEECVGVSNGLDALHLILLALGIGPGDEVIVPSNTFIATWLAVSQVGATPVPVEPDSRTYNLDPERVEAAITARTRAVIVVHLYGQPADLDPLVEVATRHDLRVVEDAAQAHGARYRGRRVGGFGDAAAWSYYPGKNLGAVGDAGAVTTRNRKLADRIRLLRNYGSRTKYVHEVAGHNNRMDEIQAAVLRVKLRHLDGWNERRRDIAKRYLDALRGVGLELPWVPDWAEPVWHLFVVRTDERDALRQRLAERGVETLIHYPCPPHLQPAYEGLGMCAGQLPVSEAIHRQVLSLPMSPHLDDAQVERVVSALRDE